MGRKSLYKHHYEVKSTIKNNDVLLCIIGQITKLSLLLNVGFEKDFNRQLLLFHPALNFHPEVVERLKVIGNCNAFSSKTNEYSSEFYLKVLKHKVHCVDQLYRTLWQREVFWMPTSTFRFIAYWKCQNFSIFPLNCYFWQRNQKCSCQICTPWLKVSNKRNYAKKWNPLGTY